jgi:hypothetical protein
MVVIGTFGTVKLALLELLDQPDPAKKLDQNRQYWHIGLTPIRLRKKTLRIRR